MLHVIDHGQGFIYCIVTGQFHEGHLTVQFYDGQKQKTIHTTLAGFKVKLKSI